MGQVLHTSARGHVTQQSTAKLTQIVAGQLGQLVLDTRVGAGGADVNTRVTRRSTATPGADRLDTSEYFEQVFGNPGNREPRLKASQCFTKYKCAWRARHGRLGGRTSQLLPLPSPSLG